MATRCPDLGPVQEVAFTDDSEKLALCVDNRRTADPALREQHCQGLDRCIRINRDHVGRHHVNRAHLLLLAVRSSSTFPRIYFGLRREYGEPEDWLASVKTLV